MKLYVTANIHEIDIIKEKYNIFKIIFKSFKLKINYYMFQKYCLQIIVKLIPIKT